MSIGTGVFLGLLCIALVLLVKETKDRWRWSTIAKWCGIAIGTPIALGFIWFMYGSYRSYLKLRPAPVIAYAGISLGDTMDDVLYSRGVPTAVLVEDKKLEGTPLAGAMLDVSSSQLPSGKKVSDYQHWSYHSLESGDVMVDFSTDSQRVVRILCYVGGIVSAPQTCPALLGIAPGASEDDVLKGLGPPSRSEISKGITTSKILYYSKWNVAYILEQRRITAFQIQADRQPTSTNSAANSVGPPRQCATAMNASECADILEKLGQNPFDAFDYTGRWPQSTDSGDSSAPSAIAPSASARKGISAPN
jgi:hypothetical protein